MPYGHIKQYRELVTEAQKKRIQITKSQQQQIAKLYRDIAKDLGKEIARKSEKTLTYRWLKDYAKSLKGQSKQIYADLQGIVGVGIFDTATAVSGAEEQFWSSIVPGMSERFRDTFSSIPQTCVDELMNGGIYKDFTGLSERLWNYKGKFDRDIGYIINRGIIEQKSAYDLAKDLEMYVDPRTKKPWEWRKVYPNCNRVVDYNAQRLARTSVTHAYQLSFQRSTADNPFIEKYQWHSSNAGKTCELCRERDGKMFPKNRVPLDHPNGMCIITAVIPKSMDEIGEELSDWAAGKENSALDKWLGRYTHQIKNKKPVEKRIDSGIIKSGARSGALTDKNDPLGRKRIRHAASYYEAVRNSKKDSIVNTIAKHSGFSKSYVSKVYDHVFVNEYDLYGGRKRFDPDYDMTESFRRLRDGKDIQEHDIILLRHEHLEYGLMHKLGLLYDEAHELAESKYDYASALKDFKKKNNL